MMNLALVPVSGTQVQRQEPEEEESPTDELATSVALTTLMAVMGVPAPIAHGVEMGHHLGEAFEMEGQKQGDDSSPNIDPGALRPDARIRLR